MKFKFIALLRPKTLGGSAAIITGIATPSSIAGVQGKQLEDYAKTKEYNVMLEGYSRSKTEQIQSLLSENTNLKEYLEREQGDKKGILELFEKLMKENEQLKLENNSIWQYISEVDYKLAKQQNQASSEASS